MNFAESARMLHAETVARLPSDDQSKSQYEVDCSCSNRTAMGDEDRETQPWRWGRRDEMATL
jgi:hypothetical protein